MFGNLPLELLTITIGYVSLFFCHETWEDGDLKKRFTRFTNHLTSKPYVLFQRPCLVSPHASFIVIWSCIPYDKDGCEKKLDKFEAVSKCEGLKYFKTLKVGPIKGKIVAIFDRLIFRLQDQSLVNFEWNAVEPPLSSQLLHIWDHQRNIQSIDLTNTTNTVKAVRPWEGPRFPQKYVHISLKLPLQELVVQKVDLSSMRVLAIMQSAGEMIPTYLSANLAHLTNL